MAICRAVFLLADRKPWPVYNQGIALEATMNCVRPLQGLLLLLAITGCGKDSDSDDTASNVSPENNSDADWEELGEDDGSSDKEDDWDGDWDEKEDGEDDTGKNSDTCGEDVIEGEALAPLLPRAAGDDGTKQPAPNGDDGDAEE